jgi:LAO/AO transport system kinase
VTTVATRGEGIDELWDAIAEHRAFQEQDGRLDERREARLREELRSIVRAELEAQVVDACRGEAFEDLVARVARRELDPHAAATELIGDHAGGGA